MVCAGGWGRNNAEGRKKVGKTIAWKVCEIGGKQFLSLEWSNLCEDVHY